MNIYQGGEKKVNLNILLAKRKFFAANFIWRKGKNEG